MSMAMFNSYVKLPEGREHQLEWCSRSSTSHWGGLLLNRSYQKKRAVARARAYVQFHQDETYLRISEIGIFQIQDLRWLKIVFVHLRHVHFRLDWLNLKKGAHAGFTV